MTEFVESLRIASTMPDLENLATGTWRDVNKLEFNHPQDLPRIKAILQIDEYEARLAETGMMPRFASSAQKAFIYVRENKICAYCETPQDARGMHADHLVPFSKGGETLVDNLVCSCKRCNYAKGVMVADEFMDFLVQYGIEGRDQRYYNWLDNVREEKGY